ncbi:hypothetical protein FRC02_010144 [Tulasnella sp. 418]|nr:hypothetical protein FRC02_010144 [Tulasnella sp. 418]
MNVFRTSLRPAYRPLHLAFRQPIATRSFGYSLRRLQDVVPPPPPPPRSRPSRFIRGSLYALKGVALLIGSTVVGVTVVTAGILVHDAFTYTEGHVKGIKVNPLALNPQRGGPKNLPILTHLIDDEEDEAKQKLSQKPKLVIVGGGWGAVGVLKSLNPGDYHVVIVSPDTYNHFTPLLPSAAVGTVSLRSLVESLRKLMARVDGHFIHGKAVDVVMSERLLEVEAPAIGDQKSQRLYIPYDKLVIAVGSVSASHGVTGLNHCFQLKTIGDAREIRRRVIENFEVASLPTTSPEERKRLLSFVICGGGPTGVETAAEISDLVQEDIMQYYPKILREEVQISIIQSRDHILNTYSEKISDYAEKKFQRDEVNVIVNARVKEVKADKVIYTIKDPETGKVKEHEISSNFVLWSTGIAMNPFTQRVSDLLPNQVHKRAIVVDAHLRVKGAPLGTVYAVGDASTIETSLLGYLLDLVEESDVNKDGKIDFDEWRILVRKLKKKVPMSSKHLEKVKELFESYDSDSDNSLNLNELAALLVEIGNKITTLPATAQVASQQGKYLGAKFSKLAKQHNVMTENDVFDDDDDSYADAFQYRHLGSLAYIGNAAVFDLGKWSATGGLAAMYAWRSVYWTEQVSARTKALLMVDWVMRGLFGRDLSKL